jgi:hypothetical protein
MKIDMLFDYYEALRVNYLSIGCGGMERGASVSPFLRGSPIATSKRKQYVVRCTRAILSRERMN